MTDTIPAAAPNIAADAKKSFSLSDRLRGVKLSTRKVIVFTDEEAVTAFAAVTREEAGLQAVLGAATEETDRASLEERQTALTARKEAARTAMLQSALSIHMRAVPDVVVDKARRAARKAYAVDGTIPDDLLEDANAKQQQIILGHVIHKIVDADGAEADFERDRIAEELRAALPLPQWTRIVRAYNEIVFVDSIGEQATLDPGF